VRVVGYIRETPDPNEGEPAFAQGERLRRWVADRGHQLVAVCQDLRVPGHALGRDGFKAMIGIIERDEADAVLVSELAILSSDKVAQEVAVYEIRRRGSRVITSDDAELELLDPMPEDRIRMVIRDVLEKAERLQAALEPGPEPHAAEPQPEREPATDDDSTGEPEEVGVVIELIPPGQPAGDPSSVMPGR